ncbi:MAG: V4R domain-containing protein [Halobacteriota archaeon]|nr:V4R domain-containing protein [Halobacteriota archaeon]
MPKNVIRGVKLKDGKLFYRGMRGAIIDVRTFTVVYKELANLIGPVAGTLIYQAEKKHIMDSMKIFFTGFGFRDVGREPLDDKSISLLLDIGLKELSQIGMGLMEIVELDFEKNFYRIHVKNSVIADSYQEEQEDPVCHFIAGMIAGGAEVILGHRMECKEVKCKARGDKYCEFIVQKEF